MSEIWAFANGKVSPAKDQKCIAISEGDRTVHIDGTADFFHELSRACVEVALQLTKDAPRTA